MSEDSIHPPFGPPDCPWRQMSGSSLPETAVYKDGKLEGEKVYVGRVRDGKNFYIGTIIPSKSICLYLDKNSEVKSASEYEILTVDCGDPLDFFEMDIDNRNIFVSGKAEDDELLYTGRFIKDGNTYYGWISKKTRSLHIARDSKLGEVLDKGFDVLIHKFLDRLCICPPCPTPSMSS